jgi:hypothetical protein
LRDSIGRRADSLRSGWRRAADLHRNHIGFVERGERAPSIDVARQTAGALGMSLSALVAEVERQWERSRSARPT